MFKKVLLSTIAAYFLVGCGGGSSSNSSDTSTTIIVERGAVLNATVKDALNQIAIWNKGTNSYVFKNSITYPISVIGGFVDINNDGIKNNSDFDLDIELKSSSGKNVTLISTIIYNQDKIIR